MKHSRASAAILLAASALLATEANACDVAGRVDGLLLDKAKVTKLDAGRMSIARGDKTLAIEDGMPVCEDDVITARSGVVAIVRVGNDAERDNAITLYGEAIITVESPTGITARIGRIFALLRGTFDVRTNFGTLGARGTQFEVNSTAAQAKVIQIEGEVEVTGPNAAASSRVRPLEQLDLSAATAQKPQALSRESCASVTATHSEVVSSTRPELPFEASGRSAGRERVAREFADARQRVLCEKQTDATAELARAWADYAEPGGVLKLIHALPPSADSRDAALYANSAGNAYRQLGQADPAMGWYERALQIDPNFAFPYNGIGDARRDRGLAALGNADVAGAVREFDLAQKSYEKSLDPGLWGKGGGTNRAIPMVNLGELALLRIAAEPAQSATLLDLAQQWFTRAQAEAGNDYAFAELGLARLDFMRALTIPDVEVQGPEGWNLVGAQIAAGIAAGLARKPHVDSAKRRLRTLLDKHPEFSAASLLLGEVHQLFGKRDDAKKHFRAAIRFDPHNVLAYLRLTEVLKSNSDKAERQLYEAAFRSAAYPALVPAMKGKAKVTEAAKPKAEIRDVRALSPSVSTVAFGSNYDGQSESVTFTNSGNAAVTVGAITITGEDASAFSVAAERCANRELAPNASCEVQVRYTGTGERNQSARLVVGSSSGMDAKVALKATQQRVNVL